MFVNNCYMGTYINSNLKCNNKKTKINKSLCFKSIFSFFIFLLILASFIFTNSLNFKKDIFYIFNKQNISSICCVISSNKTEQVISQNLYLNSIKIKKQIKSGNKDFLYLDADKTKFSNRVYDEILNFDYIEFTLKNKNCFFTFLQKYKPKLVFTESINGKLVNYYFLPFLKKHKVINNYKVNLQVVLQGEECIVGYPMIYTSY